MEERDLQGFALQARSLGERLVEHIPDQVPDPRVGQARLVLARPGNQHAMTGLLSSFHARPPQDRLADPRLTVEEEVVRLLGQVMDESGERGELSFTTDEPSRFRCQMIASSLLRATHRRPQLFTAGRLDLQSSQPDDLLTNQTPAHTV